MKLIIFLALIGVLLSGCADTPLKEADIEDRTLSTATFQAETQAKTDTPSKTDAPSVAAIDNTPARKPFEADPVLTSGLTEAEIAAKALAASRPSQPSAVTTQPVLLQEPEAKPLDASTRPGDDSATAGTAIAMSAPGTSPDDTSSLQYVSQPVLDPADPQSPLAKRRIMFDFDSAAIRDEYRTLLEMHAKYLKGQSAARLILQGHADERGSREYNLALGQRRSESVYRALNLLGVPEDQMEAVSLGEEKPIAEGHDESAWAQNRRTELLYQGE